MLVSLAPVYQGGGWEWEEELTILSDCKGELVNRRETTHTDDLSRFLEQNGQAFNDVTVLVSAGRGAQGPPPYILTSFNKTPVRKYFSSPC